MNLHWYWDGALYEGDSGLVQKSYGGDLFVNLPVWFKNYDSEGDSLVYVPEYLISRRAREYAVQWENPLI